MWITGFPAYVLLLCQVAACAAQDSSSLEKSNNVRVLQASELPPFPLIERSDGETYTARLVALDDAWNLTVETEARQIVLPLNEVHCWGSFEESINNPLVLFRDTSCLAAQINSIDRTRIVVASRQWEPTELSRDDLHAVLLRPPLSDLERDRWLSRLSNPPVDDDVVYLANGDRLQCELLGSKRRIDRSTADEAVPLLVRLSGEVLELDVEDVVALRFRRPDTESESPGRGKAVIGFRDGSRFHCQRLRIERDFVEFELAGGSVLRSRRGYARSRLWRQLSFVRPATTNSIFLSDIEPAQYESLAVWGHQWEYRSDRNVLDGALRHAGKRFDKGLGMHATSSLAYVLDGKRSRFRAWLGVDESAGTKGSVVFRIYGTRDGTEWEEIYHGPLQRGGGPLMSIVVDIEDIYAITISVDQADGSVVMDRANWIEARVE